MASKSYGTVFADIASMASLGDTTTFPFSSSTLPLVVTLKRMINMNHKYIMEKTKGYDQEVETTIPTVSNQNDYAISPIATTSIYIEKINYIYITIGNRRYYPTKVEQEMWNNLMNYPAYTSDIIQYYIIDANKLRIFPAPKTAGLNITINYFRMPIDLDASIGTTDANTVLQIREGWERVLIYKTLADFYAMREDEQGVYDRYKKESEELMRQYLDEVSTFTTSPLVKRGKRRIPNPLLFPTGLTGSI